MLNHLNFLKSVFALRAARNNRLPVLLRDHFAHHLNFLLTGVLDARILVLLHFDFGHHALHLRVQFFELFKLAQLGQTLLHTRVRFNSLGPLDLLGHLLVQFLVGVTDTCLLD